MTFPPKGRILDNGGYALTGRTRNAVKHKGSAGRKILLDLNVR